MAYYVTVAVPLMMTGSGAVFLVFQGGKSGLGRGREEGWEWSPAWLLLLSGQWPVWPLENREKRC